MPTATITTPDVAVPRTAARRRTARLLGVGGAVLAAVASWAVIAHGFGVAVRAPGPTAEAATDIGAGHVMAASAVAALAGWAVLALLERLTARAARLWTVIALGVLVMSFGGPLSGAGISAANRGVLLALHVVVAAVLVPVLYGTSVRRGRPS